MKGKPFRRLSSLMLVLCMVACMLPATLFMPSEVQAAAGDIFADTQIDNTKRPDGYSNDGSNPYGRKNVIINPVGELFVGADFTVDSLDNSKPRGWKLYGHNETPNLSNTSFEASSTPGNKYDLYLTATGNFVRTSDYSAQKHIVALGANTIRNKASSGADRSDAGLYMYFIDPLTGAQTSGGAIEIYKGAIGNLFELDGGYLRYNSSTDKNDGGSLVKGFYNPYLLANYMQVATGDFDGDGAHEIAVYVPNPANPRVDIYKYTGESNAWKEAAGWRVVATRSLTLSSGVLPNKVSMVVGDINYDGVDDLAVGYSMQNYNNKGSVQNNVAGKLSVYFGSGNSSIIGSAVNVDTGIQVPYSLAMSDLAGNGRDWLTVAQSTYAANNDSARTVETTVTIQSFPFNPADKTFSSAKYTMVSTGDTGNVLPKDSLSPHVHANAVSVSTGVGKPDRLYYRGYTWYISSDGIVRSAKDSIYTTYKSSLEGNSTDSFFEYGVTAADLDYNYCDEIIGYYVPVDGNDDGPTTQPARGLVQTYDSATNKIKQQYRMELDKATRHDRSCVLLAVPDTDNDTIILTYKSQYLTYTDPKILAVMAGAPLHKELEDAFSDYTSYIENSGTTWSTSKGVGTSTTKSGVFSIGAYISYDHDVTVFGVPVFSLEMEAEYKHSITWETEKTEIVTETITYDTRGYKDAVALYSVPVVTYVYDMIMPDGTSGKTQMQEYRYNVPYSASVTVLELDEYEEIAEKYDDLPAIRGTVLTHTQGDPYTYPSSTAGFSDVRVPTSSPLAQVAYGGTGIITQSISVETTQTESTSHEDAFSFKAGAGGGGLKVGITLGGSAGYGKAKISTAGNSFSGTVCNMPRSAQNLGYDYQWMVMNYWHTFPDGKKVPVVTYIVPQAGSSSRPINPPQNVAIDLGKTATDSLTLTWDYPTGMGISHFMLYRKTEQQELFEPVDTTGIAYSPQTGSYQFTDTGLNANQKHSYYVKAVSTTGLSSIMSNTVSGWTAGVGVTLSYQATPDNAGYVMAKYTSSGVEIKTGGAVANQSSVTMTAVPQLGYEFVTWRKTAGAAGPVEVRGTVDSAGASTYAFNMPGSSVLMEAVFQPIPPDTTKPQIELVSPSGAGAELSSDLYVMFDEPMNTEVKGTVTASPAVSFNYGEWMNDTTYRIAYAGTGSDGKLAPGTKYALSISGFKDLAGNLMAADSSHSFTTKTATERVVTMYNTLASSLAPVSQTKLKGEVRGSLYNFSTSDMKDHTFKLNNLDNVPGLSLGAVNYVIDNSFYIDAHITKDTPPGIYRLSLTVNDKDGGAAVTSNIFMLRVYDGTKPTVNSIIPVGTGAPTTGTLHILFNEDMNTTAAGTVSLNNGGGTLSGGSWSNSTIYSIPYSSLANETTFTVSISGFKDIANNEMVADNTKYFTTAGVVDVVSPAVLSVAPSGLDVPTSEWLCISFSEAMSTTPGTVSLDNGVGVLTGGGWLNDGYYTIPYKNLNTGTAYTVSISGFADAAGNLMEPTSSHSFTTYVPAIIPSLAGSFTISTLTPQFGDTLTLDTTALATNPAGGELGLLSYQWQRGGVDIPGAQDDTYTATADDIGQTLGVVIAAANCLGRASVTTEAVSKRVPTAADITCSFDDAVYDGVGPVQVVSGCEGMGKVTVHITGTDGESYPDVGTYNVSADAEAGSTYADATGIALGSFTIEKAPIGGADQTLSIAKGATPGEFDYDLSTLLPSLSSPLRFGNVSYTVTAIANDDGVLTANNPLELTVSLDEQNRPIVSLPVAEMTEAGKSATVTVGIGSGNFEDISATLTVQIIDKEPVTITGITAPGGTYSGSAIAYSGTPVVKTSTGETVTPALEAVYQSADDDSYGPSSEPPVNAGNYLLMLRVLDSDEDYAGSASYTFSILPKRVTVSAPAHTIRQGDALPSLAVTYAGWVGADNEGNALTTRAVAAHTATDSSTAGRFGIVFTTQAVANGNYTLQHKNGELVITPKSSEKSITAVLQPQNAKISGTFISATVADSVASQSIGVSVSPGATWELFRDQGCTLPVANKILSLNVGSNASYIRVTAEDGSTRVYAFTITRAAAPVATMYTLTVNMGSGGGSYASDWNIPISADAAPSGQKFDSWVVLSGSGSFQNAASPNTTFKMPAGNAVVVATYQAIAPQATTDTYTLTVTGGVGSGSYEAGQQVPISAGTAPAGQVFSRWSIRSGGGALVSETSSVTTFIMPAANVQLDATYKSAGSTITVPGSTSGVITITLPENIDDPPTQPETQDPDDSTPAVADNTPAAQNNGNTNSYKPEDTNISVPSNQVFFIEAPEGSLQWDTAELTGVYDGGRGGYMFALKDSGKTGNVLLFYTNASGDVVPLGVSISDGETALAGPAGTTKRVLPWWIWLLIVLAILLFVSGIIWLVWAKRRKEEDEKKEEKAPDTPSDTTN